MVFKMIFTTINNKISICIGSILQVVIKTNYGYVRGIVKKTNLNEREVLKFPNIPYAEPPVGQFRFEKPRPKLAWNGKNVFRSSIA